MLGITEAHRFVMEHKQIDYLGKVLKNNNRRIAKKISSIKRAQNAFLCQSTNLYCCIRSYVNQPFI